VCVIVSGASRPIHDIYQSGLLAYGKVHYDVFRRVDKFSFTRFGRTICTTLGQLTFFRDAIRFGILEYAYAHIGELKSEMYNDTSYISALQTPEPDKSEAAAKPKPKAKPRRRVKKVVGDDVKQPRASRKRPATDTEIGTEQQKQKQNPTKRRCTKHAGGVYAYSGGFTLKFRSP
jgi:hypothetical protein